MLIQLAVGFALGWVARSINFENPSMSDFKFSVHGEDEPGVWLVGYEQGGKKRLLSGPTGPLFWRDKARAQKNADHLKARGMKAQVQKHTNKTRQLYAKAANANAITLAETGS